MTYNAEAAPTPLNGSVGAEATLEDHVTDFVLVPGAWAGGWLWDDVARELEAQGYATHQLTLSGLGEEAPREEVRLNTHVEDVRSYIASHNLKSVMLVGHSYSGVVVGQVSSRYPELIDHTIFVEAFLPVDGQSLLEVSGLDIEEEFAALAKHEGNWPAPSPEEMAIQPGLTRAQIDLLLSRQQPHPGATVADPAKLNLPLEEISATFIAHEGWLSGSRGQELLNSLRGCPKWKFRTIDGGHWPMLSVPRELSVLLVSTLQ